MTDFNPRTPCGVRPFVASSRVMELLNFNPRTPCGVRPVSTTTMTTSMVDFNPRTPCGVRRHQGEVSTNHFEFQSTHPVRGATLAVEINFSTYVISIHAPRAGCDHVEDATTNLFNIFQSTHPVRGATRGSVSSPARSGFQSTHPVRGATRGARRWTSGRRKFQSTHPVRGATSAVPDAPQKSTHFNPRTPCGVRLCLGQL